MISLGLQPAPIPQAGACGSLEPGTSGGLRAAPWLISLVAVALYLGTLSFEFVWDDLQQVVFNQYIRRLEDLPTWLRLTVTEVTFGDVGGNRYRPGYILSLALDYALWDEWPLGFHLTNVLLHGLMVWLVYHLTRAVARETELATLTALLFAVYPTHAETVAWVAARGHLLAGIWMVTAALWYLRSRDCRGWRRVGIYAGALGAMAAGLTCQESSAVFPAIILLLDALRQDGQAPRSGGWSRSLLRMLPFSLLAIAYLAFLSRPMQTYNPAGFSLGTTLARLPGSLETFGRYVWLVAAPFHLHPYYNLTPPATLVSPWPLLGAGLLVGLLVAIGFAWKRSPASVFGLGWFLITLAPYLNLVAIYGQPMVFADRYLYAPSVGLLILLAGLLRRGTHAMARGRLADCYAYVPLLTVGSLGLLYGGTALQYLPVWRDNVHLYSRMIQDVPHVPEPHLNLGTTFLDRGEIDRGIRELETAARLAPDWVRPQFSLALATLGRDPQAAFRIFDRVAAAAADDQAYYLMRGRAHLSVREPAEAVRVLTAGLLRFPESAGLHLLLGHAREAQAELRGALEAYRRAMALDPRLVAAHEGAARILARQGDMEAAAASLERALTIAPRRLPSLHLLALIRQTQGRGEDSLRLWREVAAQTQDPRLQEEALRRIRSLMVPGGAARP